jgi:hypothetical protein
MNYTIPGKASVIITQDQYGFVLTLGKWLEVHEDDEQNAWRVARELAAIERVTIQFVKINPSF